MHQLDFRRDARYTGQTLKETERRHSIQERSNGQPSNPETNNATDSADFVRIMQPRKQTSFGCSVHTNEDVNTDENSSSKKLSSKAIDRTL